MPRYIDIDKYDKYYYECSVPENDCKYPSCFECFYNNGGAEEVAPVVHSSWRQLYKYLKCNNCGQRSVIPTNYCPNCGAKMDIE